MAAMTIGSGEYTYEVVKDWARLPKGWRFGAVSAVAVDSQDRLYVYQRDSRPVLVFDRQGNFLASWGEGVIADAHGIFIGPDDSVYLVDRGAHQVLKFTSDGKLLLTIGNRDRPAMGVPFNHPADVAVSLSGDTYVADGYGNSRVHRFSPEGKHLLSWGSPGSGPGQFMVPHGIWVDRENRVYVVDRENNRIQVFTSEGAFLTEWTGFYRPMDIYVDANERVYVTDHVPRLSILDMKGNALARGLLGDDGHGIWGDSRGDFYVGYVYERSVWKYVRRS